MSEQAHSPEDLEFGKGKNESKRPACTGCRTIKVRCRLPPNEPSASVCTRCIRLTLPCEYPPPATKGRKPRQSGVKGSSISVKETRREDTASEMLTHRSGSRSMAENSPPAHSSMPSTSGSSQLSFSAPSLPSPRLSSNPWANSNYVSVAPNSSHAIAGPSTNHAPIHALPRPSMSSHAVSSSSIQTVHYTGGGGPANHPSVSSTTSTGNAGSPRLSEGAASNGRRQLVGGENAMDHSLRSLVQAAEVTMAENAGRADAESKKSLAPPPYVDPIDLHILGVIEADQLVRAFHEKLNPFIKILDPHLHTMEYCRKHSSILFSAVLCVAAKFSRPDLYPQLLTHAHQLVGRALADNVCHIGVVQALGMLVYWKEPTDASAWMKVGIAIRMGYQLRLDRKRTEPLPADELEARIILDRERTWLNLVCFDKSYHLYDESEGRRVGLMIADETRDLDKWLQEGFQYGVEDDSLLALSVETGRITELRRNIESSNSVGAAHALTAHLTQWLKGVHLKWTDSSSPHYRCSRPEAAQKMRMMNTYTFAVLVQSLLVATEFKDEVVLAEYIARAGDFIDESVNLIKNVIDVVQDSVAVALFVVAEFFYKLFPIVNVPNQTTIVRWLTQVYSACRQVQNGRESCVTAYIARFYRQVLRMISASSSMPATRPGSPVPQSNGTPALGTGGLGNLLNGQTGQNGMVKNETMDSHGGNGMQIDQPQPSFAAEGNNPFAGLGTIGHELFQDFSNDNNGLSLFDGLSSFDGQYWDTLIPGASTSDWSWFGASGSNTTVT